MHGGARSGKPLPCACGGQRLHVQPQRGRTGPCCAGCFTRGWRCARTPCGCCSPESTWPSCSTGACSRSAATDHSAAGPATRPRVPRPNRGAAPTSPEALRAPRAPSLPHKAAAPPATVTHMGVRSPAAAVQSSRAMCGAGPEGVQLSRLTGRRCGQVWAGKQRQGQHRACTWVRSGSSQQICASSCLGHSRALHLVQQAARAGRSR
mmetsp:Transcript_26611/g.58049  ORF Transcript_26611/g.58049 Transcript_26611/m.58049 type:complete len:207 (-) Transcript_26611:82-702(-)